MLTAQDELRHPWDGDFHWRESLYFNFADPANEIGGWIYLWVLPNQPMKSGMLVSFYHGLSKRLDSNEAAMASPGHLLEEPDGGWVYCYKQDVPSLVEEDFDDVELCGLRVKREAPLERYSLSFADGAGNGFDLDCRFMTDPWDYEDGFYPTPKWLAQNRYHRCWWANGELRIAGERYHIETTGDSDHSWGTRDRGIFATRALKTWSLQSPDGQLSVVATRLGNPGDEVLIGYVAHGRDMQSVRSIEDSAAYDAAGVQQDIRVRVTDVAGRVVEAAMPRMFGCVGGGPRTTTWGFEGAGHYDVPGYGDCTGIASYWWPAGKSPGS